MIRTLGKVVIEFSALDEMLVGVSRNGIRIYPAVSRDLIIYLARSLRAGNCVREI